MAKTLFLRWQKWLLVVAVLGLTLTGMGQMPIFSRYYIADLPGLGWLGQYRITAALHLGLAAVLLFLLVFWAMVWIGTGGRPALSQSGWWRVALYGGVAVTGTLRVLQNGLLPLFGPLQVRYLDWTHLGMALALLVVLGVIGRGSARRGVASPGPLHRGA